MPAPAAAAAPPPKTDAEAMAVDEPPAKTEEQKLAEANAAVLADIKQSIGLVERGASSLESRFIVRAVRASAAVRHRVTLALLVTAITTHLSTDQPIAGSLLKALEAAGAKVDVDMEPADDAKPAAKPAGPETELFLALLVLVFLHDQQHHLIATQLSNSLVAAVQSLNRRTLDPITARLFFYHARLYELSGHLADIRPQLLAAHRTATLRHDDETQAAILNILLRNYLQLNQIEQADKLVSKAVFPETVGNNQAARYTYYLGRIRAIQLDYSTSHRHLLQAIRKAPQSDFAAGFQQTVTKLAIIVQLLMGEIPERSTFREPTLRKALVPYLCITQAVRIGDLAKFQEALATYGAVFRNDKNLSLILRLRHNVIKAGVRRISLAYSRISLRDICIKLQLDSEEDAEYIVAKAIRDGVIDASIDHEKGFMKSNENVDLYSTNEPQGAFHQRISFCLNLHNESVKALRFPSDAHRKELSKANELLEEERKLAKGIVDGELDDEEEDMDF
ncbi:proteasome regulatory subunit C-terminal-domain-containing protein [Entophlyctis helioformis]|nr:proteasome regulatory subunit C-terminal-domain-containing protein [Entophlyctis helioformis]